MGDTQQTEADHYRTGTTACLVCYDPKLYGSWILQRDCLAAWGSDLHRKFYKGCRENQHHVPRICTWAI